jgi:adenine-specific DNA-methyltransferase
MGRVARNLKLGARVGTQTTTSRKGKKNGRVIDCKLELRDAFDFLAQLKPGSVDLFISSPPYCMGKEYDTSFSIKDFIDAHEQLAPLLVRALRQGGSLCWQVGHHVRDGVAVPLDALVYSIFSRYSELFLRNRIIWTFGHGVHAKRRFSGRHEAVLWFTKGRDYCFNLDAVRIPQKYPGKKHYKGPNKGHFSGNPKGKNPSDVWEIPNVKSRHVEKTDHPCQFPVALAQRLIRALAPANGLVSDPFVGSGTSALAAALEGRRFAGCDIKQSYLVIASERLAAVSRGDAKYRPLERPIYQPADNEMVAKRPPHFASIE